MCMAQVICSGTGVGLPYNSTQHNTKKCMARVICYEMESMINEAYHTIKMCRLFIVKSNLWHRSLYQIGVEMVSLSQIITK